MTNKTLIDCHVHLAALPDGDNGCYISPKMLKSPLFRFFLLWKHQLSPDKPREANQKYLDDLLANYAPLAMCRKPYCSAWMGCTTRTDGSIRHTQIF